MAPTDLIRDLEPAYESLVLTADDGLVLDAFTAGPGTVSADALSMPASWAAAADHAADSYEPSGAETPAGLLPWQGMAHARRR